MQDNESARHAVEYVIGIATILAILFGITLVGVTGFFFLRLIANRPGSKPSTTFQQKARAAFQAADLGWLALVCGPLCGVLVLLIELTHWIFQSAGPRTPAQYEITYFGVARACMLMMAAGIVAGVMLASAFWVSSSLLGKVRKATKRCRGMYDPEFDGPV
jgi:hypothetical protein